jgi:hypothetical protein
MDVPGNEVAAHRAAVRQRHRRVGGRIDHVAVRQQKTIRREDDARPATTLKIDFDDGGSDDLDRANHGARIGVEQFRIREGFGVGSRHVPIVGTDFGRHTTRTGRIIVPRCLAASPIDSLPLVRASPRRPPRPDPRRLTREQSWQKASSLRYR